MLKNCLDTGAYEVPVTGSYRFKNVDIVLTFKYSLIFKVRMASAAIIAFTTHLGNYDGDIYEIVIGANDNTESLIRYVPLTCSFTRVT